MGELKRVIPVVLVAEACKKTSELNAKIEDCTAVLKNVEKTVGGEIRVAVVSYSEEAELLTNGFEPLDRLGPVAANCGSEAKIGKALTLISERLLVKENFKRGYVVLQPLVVFFGGGNSSGEYRAILAKIKNENPMFSIAEKIAIIGGEPKNISEFLAITEKKENFFSEFDVATAYEVISSLKYMCSSPVVSINSEYKTSRICTDFVSMFGERQFLSDHEELFLCRCIPCELSRANEVPLEIWKFGSSIELLNKGILEKIEVKWLVKKGRSRCIDGVSCKSLTVSDINGAVGIFPLFDTVTIENTTDTDLYVTTLALKNRSIKLDVGDELYYKKKMIFAVNSFSCEEDG